jgi:hypothetical protein
MGHPETAQGARLPEIPYRMGSNLGGLSRLQTTQHLVKRGLERREILVRSDEDEIMHGPVLALSGHKPVAFSFGAVVLVFQRRWPQQHD